MKRLKRKKRIASISYDIEKELWGFQIMRKTILKIVLVLLVAGINWMGISSVGRTIAYFNDLEQSLNNIYQAGTLDFYLHSQSDFSLNITPSASTSRQINVLNQGSLPFQYIIKPEDFQGNLCGNLNLEARLNSEVKYSGKLADFILNPPIMHAEPNNWQFLISFEGDSYEYNKETCQFYFNFMGWQDNMANYALSGFDDRERAFTKVTLHRDKTVVLNEIVSDPFGDDCSLTGLEGEWVELYNNSGMVMDLSGWYLKDLAGHKIIINDSNTLSGSTNILPKGWLVVFLDGCVLNNDSDSVKLYHSAGIELVDSYSYFKPKPEGSSFARIPDGVGAWFDPIPTPGAPNKLEIKTEPAADLFFAKPLSECLESELENAGIDGIINTATPQSENIFRIFEPEMGIKKVELEPPKPIMNTTTSQNEDIFKPEAGEGKLELLELPELIISTATPQDENIFEPEIEEVELELPEAITETVTPTKEETILIGPENNKEENEKENEKKNE